MPYLLLLVNADAGTSEILSQFEDEASAARCRSFSTSLGGAPPAVRRAGAPGNPVSVVGVAEGGDSPLAVGDLFETAFAASVAAGYSYNAVGQALRLARVRGGSRAVLRGVEFSYAEDLGKS